MPSKGIVRRELKFACIAAMVSALCAKCFLCQTLGLVVELYWLLGGFMDGGSDFFKVAACVGWNRA